ncbi:MAG: hypothetical protein ACK5TE_15365 [Pseudomonadota bacterium]
MSPDPVRWRYRGTAHCFGDDLEHDAHMIPFEFVIRRVTDPAELLPHLFEAVRPGLAARMKAGDVLVAGQRFGKGKAHIQAYLALKAIGVAIVCESLPYNTYRALVGLGLPFMSGCEGVTGQVADGEEIEVDFSTGAFINHSRGTRHAHPPLPSQARDIIELGGTEGVLRDWWARTRAAEHGGR